MRAILTRCHVTASSHLRHSLTPLDSLGLTDSTLNMAKQKARSAPSSPFDYKDRTERLGPTEAHMSLGGDRRSFMFEQVLPEACACVSLTQAWLHERGLAKEELGREMQSASAAGVACSIVTCLDFPVMLSGARAAGFEQVRSVWITRNWCWILSTTIGLIGPGAVERPITTL